MQIRSSTAAAPLAVLSACPFLILGCSHHDGTSSSLIGGAAAVASPPSTRAGVAWKPDPASAKSLSREVRLQQYAIRPPRGFRVDTGKSAGRMTWLISRSRGRDVHALPGVFLSVISGSRPVAVTPAALVSADLQQNSGNYRAWIASPVEEGVIGGIPFARAYWKGISVETGQSWHGFTYEGVDGGAMITLIGSSLEQGYRKTLSAAEAGVLSLH